MASGCPRNAKFLCQPLYQYMMLFCIRGEPRVWDQALNGAYCCIGPHIPMNKLEAQRKAQVMGVDHQCAHLQFTEI